MAQKPSSPTDSELLKIYRDANDQAGPIDVPPDQFIRLFRDAERKEKRLK